MSTKNSCNKRLKLQILICIKTSNLKQFNEVIGNKKCTYNEILSVFIENSSYINISFIKSLLFHKQFKLLEHSFNKGSILKLFSTATKNNSLFLEIFDLLRNNNISEVHTLSYLYSQHDSKGIFLIFNYCDKKIQNKILFELAENNQHEISNIIKQQQKILFF